ncbi:MAG: hypothetical protein JO254_02685 [Pseudolabrys sp.]|nr:hypothetical protein [Pseudolabrys sp.]
MKRIALALAFSLAATGAFAQSGTCKTNAKGSDGKMLAGAAMSSYMKKCQADAAKSCDSQAAEKKLSGAAKTSFTKKCVSDAVGT